MSETEDKLNQLQTRLVHLERYEEAFKRELADIRREIYLLKTKASDNQSGSQIVTEKRPPIREKVHQQTQTEIPSGKEKQEADNQAVPIFEMESAQRSERIKAQSNLEKFIGENLISKIGIVVLIIGVAIGAKYAIDNNLISPLMRIVFGYAVGLSLIGLAIKLKSKYLNYSAVLMSGGMAIMYFITYFAYTLYSIFSQTSAFGLMFFFTVFTVLASLIYNRQIIAHIGLVGAYAVPFLVSENSGRVDILFSYIAIINIGILAISVLKYWKPLYFTSFAFTWLIYSAWYFDDYKSSDQFSLAFSFLILFFSIFYISFISYKVLHKEPFKVENVFLILFNSFLFYGIGYSILDTENLERFLGFYTVINAFIHFAVGAVIYKLKLGDRTAFYLIVALVLTFLTIAVPVQFDGNWITLLWIAEAVFLFTIGRTRRIPLFEYYSFPLITFASVSLVNDWQQAFLPNRKFLKMPFIRFSTVIFIHP